ncbi:MAG: type IV secretion system DNA-binding domain-containing protein [Patescibacteria group bacterium]|jgi:hypothetical protein
MELNIPIDEQIISSALLNQIIFWLFIIIFVIVAAVILVFILRKILSSHKLYPAIFEKKIFMLTVPEFDLDKNDENKVKNIKELLAGVENFYASLGGLMPHKGFKTWLFGRYDCWSFEMVVGSDGLITFYMAVPVYLENYIKQQILSQFPHCQIEEVEDYNIFNQQGYVAGGYLKLAKQSMFPILTYKQMETDPILGILSTLSKLPPGHTVAIQFVMRSASPNWRKRGVKVASEMQQGKKLKDAMSSASSTALSKTLGKPSDWLPTSTKKDDSKPPELYKLSPMEEQMVKFIEEKAAKSGLDVNIRIITFAPVENLAKDVLRHIANAFSQYSSYQYANSFKAVLKGSGNKLIQDFIYRNFDESNYCVLNSEEMASLWHLPYPNTEVPRIKWLQAKRLAPPVNMPATGIVLGENDFRGMKHIVRIKDEDRRRHMYIVGMTGTGKSYFMSHMALQDIAAGKGVCIVDPHGSFVEDILPYIPKNRLDDVIIFDPSDMERPMGLNMLEAHTPYEMDMAAQEMINIFYKLLPDPAMAGPMFEHYMRNALLALMADQDDPGTLVELARIFTDETYRKQKLEHVTDILVKDFWEREYPASQKGSTGSDMLSYVISKTGRFVENELMRNIIGQSRSGINFRQVMDEGKILLMNLCKGKIGETNSNLLGLIAVSKLQMAALGRADLPEDQRNDFYLYIDEFQNFITDSISIILSEARKYKLNLIMGHQFIAQLVQNNDTRVRDAIFGNVGTVAAYRIGVDDAETIAKQLGPQVSEYDVMNTEKFSVYLRLLIDNAASDPFNMKIYNFKDYFQADKGIVAPLKELSRLKFGRDRKIVVREIVERSRIGQMGMPARPKF